jgi:predicted proteasome-type protease
MYYTNSLLVERRYRFEDSSEYLRKLNAAWDKSLRQAFGNMPPIAWSQAWDQVDSASEN